MKNGVCKRIKITGDNLSPYCPMESYSILARSPPTRCKFFQRSVYCPYFKEMKHNKQRMQLKIAAIIIGIVIFLIAVIYLTK